MSVYYYIKKRQPEKDPQAACALGGRQMPAADKRYYTGFRLKKQEEIVIIGKAFIFGEKRDRDVFAQRQGNRLPSGRSAV
ncbi:MAG: hypothetical protein ACLTOU_02370 [Acutalibacter sp.]